jgi:hypothetical protein
MNPIASLLRRLGPQQPERTLPYHCLGCGASFDVQYHVCPCCRGYSVEPVVDYVDGVEDVDGVFDEANERTAP